MLTGTTRIFAAKLRFVQLLPDTLPSNSSTSLTPGAGPHTLTIGTGLSLAAGAGVLIEKTGDPTTWILTRVASYDAGSGSLTTLGGSIYAGTGAHASWTVYDAPLRFSTHDLVTRPADAEGPIPYTVSLLRPLNYERAAWHNRDGYLDIGGASFPAAGTVVLSNGDGALDWLGDVSFDGYEISVHEISTELDEARGRWVPEAQTEWTEWFVGTGVGSPDVTDTRVTVGLGDYSQVLRSRIQTRPMLGLGGCIAGDPTGNGYGQILHHADFDLSEFTIIILAKPHADDVTNSTYFLGKSTVGTTPFFWRVAPSGGTDKYRFRCNTDTGNALLDARVAVAGEWVWLIATYDSTETLRTYSKGLWETEVSSHGSSGPNKGTPNTNTDTILVGTILGQTAGSRWKGGYAHLRFYDRALSATEIADVLRPLDLEDAADTADLVEYIPFDERFGDLAVGVINDHHCELTVDLPWGTLGTGRPEQLGKWFPITAGPARSVPLTYLDELPDGGVYTCNFRSIQLWRYVLSGGVALAPDESFTEAGLVWGSAKTRIITAPAGSNRFRRFVPDMQFTFASTGGPSSNDGTYTVEAPLGPDAIRIKETIAAPGADGGDVVTVSPGWTVYDAGGADTPTLILIYGARNDPITAWVEGDDGGAGGYVDSVEEQLEMVCSELGPGVPSASLDFTRMARGTYKSSFHVGTEEVEALDTVHRLAYSIGAHVGAGQTAGGIEFVTVELDDASSPVARLVKEDIEAMEAVRMRGRPSAVVLGFQPAFEVLTGDVVEAAWQKLVDQARQPYQSIEEPLPSYIADRIPTAVPTKLVETLLAVRTEAQAEAERRAGVARAKVYRVRIGLPLGELRIGEKLHLTYDRHGYAAGAEVLVLGVTKVPDTQQIDVAVVLPPEDLAA